MTTICSFIQGREHKVWDYLSRVFSLNLKAAELGFTDDLVFRIVEFYSGTRAKCEVYIKHSKHESIRGADIDLFIFNGTSYDFYMVQAKIMNSSGIYFDIRKFDPHNAKKNQYVTLIKAANTEGAFPLYLLFNGRASRSVCTSGCGLNAGYSIIEARDILGNRLISWLTNLKKRNAPRIRFNEMCCAMKPLHYLFCPGHKAGFNLPPGKAYSQIYKGDSYRHVFGSINQGLDSNTEETGSDVDPINENDRIPVYVAPVRIIINDESIYG